MKDQVLWRKISRIVMQLSQVLHVSPERALDIFYDTHSESKHHGVQNTEVFLVAA